MAKNDRSRQLFGCVGPTCLEFDKQSCGEAFFVNKVQTRKAQREKWFIDSLTKRVY
jgi:hypothetical protein